MAEAMLGLEGWPRKRWYDAGGVSSRVGWQGVCGSGWQQQEEEGSVYPTRPIKISGLSLFHKEISRLEHS